MKFRIPSIVIAVAASLNVGMAQASCGSAFCVLDTNWATQGMANEPGTLRLDLRYEFVDQKHLRSGGKQIPASEDTGDTTELRTLNRNLLTTLDYAFSNNWTISASAPVVTRSHSHISDPTGNATLESWNFTKIGDARVLGYYRLDNPDPMLNRGLIAGLKFPTGDYQVKNGDGTVAERALQPGSGSTDMVVGGYYSAPGWHPEASWSVQGLVQQAVATKDGFKPGRQYQLNLGYRYPINDSLQALAQINTLIKTRDTGVNAEPELSGSKSVFLSPGLSYSLTHDVQLYGFVQLPVYRYVNGTQLSADWSVSVGMTMRF
jgi:Putative MetA-pathway of phenol degradation